MTWTNGRFFKETFDHNKSNGFGVIVYPLRRKIFEGYFQNGKAHGQTEINKLHFIESLGNDYGQNKVYFNINCYD